MYIYKFRGGKKKHVGVWKQWFLYSAFCFLLITKYNHNCFKFKNAILVPLYTIQETEYIEQVIFSLYEKEK